MKAVIRCICALILLALCIQTVSASFTVGKVTMSSKGKTLSDTDRLSAGTPVTATAELEFSASGGETFPNEDTLLLATELDNAQWNYIRILDGNSDPAVTAKGKNVNINGWMLSFPARQDLAMKVSVEGTAPTVASSGEKIIIRIADLDRKNNVVSGSEVIKKLFIVNPEEITGVTNTARTELAAFRTAIDEKAAEGIDTTAAELKYSEAATALQNADSSTAASKFTEAQGYSANAKTLIKQGTGLLDKGWAEKLVQDAQHSLDTTDEMITYFTVNRSLGSDQRLAPLIESRDSAANLISDANDLINQGNYESAREKANEALNKAKSTFDDAIVLRQSIGEGGGPLDSLFSIFRPGPEASETPAASTAPAPSGNGIGGILVYILAVAGVVVIGVVGIVLYRKRSRWDELG